MGGTEQEVGCYCGNNTSNTISHQGPSFCNAVRSIPALKNIEDMVTIIEKGVGITATVLTSEEKYENYKTLLIEACQTYETKARSSHSRYSTTKTFLYQIHNPYDSVFEMNTDVDVLMAYQFLQTSPASLPQENMKSLQYQSTHVPSNKSTCSTNI